MTKNLIGGNKHRKGSKSNNRNKIGEFDPKIHMYAQVKKKVGEKNIEVSVENGGTKIVSIPGRLYKKVWIKIKDYLVITGDEIEWIITENSKQESDAKKVLETVVKGFIKDVEEDTILNDDGLDFDEV